MSIASVMPSNHLILCHPLLLRPSIFPSIRVFSNESVLGIRWPKYWSFSFSISFSSEHSGPISFRTDWLNLLAVQRTLKSLLQDHSFNVHTNHLERKTDWGGLRWGGASGPAFPAAPWVDSSFTSVGTKHVPAAVRLAPRYRKQQETRKEAKRKHPETHFSACTS